MSKKKILLLLMAFLNFYFGLLAQNTPQFSFSHSLLPSIILDGKDLNNAWSGGINTAQISTIDLNLDQIQDLVVFDKTCGRLSTYVAVSRNNSWVYEYAPEFEFAFPEFVGWVLLRDYDQDGKKDIFTHTNFGIKVYKNISDLKSLKFELLADPIYTQGFGGRVNLQVNVIDVPAIVDLDDDGDLDIVTYDFASGSYLEYHQNLSTEKYGKPHQLEFKKISNCWGALFESLECGDFRFDHDCNAPNRNGGGGGKPENRIEHIGSTITILDVNGDRQKDLLVGDVSCPHIYYLENVKNSVDARFEKYDTLFPKSKPIHFEVFPAVFWEDLDFDGKKDLLASPNVFVNEYNRIDFSRSLWFYKNVGTEAKPDFQFQQDNFLQNTLLDLGEDAFPTLADYDADGDLDLFVGNHGSLQSGKFAASLALFENIGTAQNPRFQLKNKDFLNLSDLGLWDFRVYFQDLNGDRSPDLCLSAGDQRNTFFYTIPNLAVQNQAFKFDPKQLQKINLPIQKRDFPVLWDTDKDGDLDLIVGGRSGNLAFYENKGSFKQADYQLVSDTLLGISKNSFKRNLIPVVADLDQDGKPDLLTGDGSGKILFYADFLNPAQDIRVGTAALFYNPQNQDFGSFYFGKDCYPTLGDLDGDQKPELIVGTQAGGLLYLKNISGQSSSTNLPEAFASLKITLNTENKSFRVFSAIPLQIEIYLLGGKTSLKQGFAIPQAETAFELKSLPGTSFMLKISTSEGEVLERRVDF
ncbi:MAG: VCBS repeat-containing protein [Microscillaceae bacterium]|nr:VCBS repeat-containing protein [Microscillaceae bacterium]